MTKPKTPASASRARHTAHAVAGLLDGTYPNVYQACKATGASPATVSRHLQGGQMRHQANLEHMYLTSTEESCYGASPGALGRDSATLGGPDGRVGGLAKEAGELGRGC